jgi:secreted trypsin-like serine protease
LRQIATIAVFLRRRLQTGFFVALTLLSAPSAALVGPASRDDGYAAHLVMILNRGFDKAGFCTGVVVGRRAVLTAAHCIVSSENMRIFYRDASGQPVLGEVEAAIVHPSYRADAVVKRVISIDLALVETRTPLDPRFSPAELDSSGQTSVGEALQIFGYGVASEGDGRSAGVLRAAGLVVRAPLSSILLWAEDPNGQGVGACTGDSGGPIVSAAGGKVLAIVAWSSGARRGSHCGALTQGPLVGPQMDWITRTLEGWR